MNLRTAMALSMQTNSGKYPLVYYAGVQDVCKNAICTVGVL